MRLPPTIVLLLLGGIFGKLHACSIPVFRCALDRWQADPFALEISANDAKDAATSVSYGMVVAQGRLYVASVDGKVMCYGKK